MITLILGLWQERTPGIFVCASKRYSDSIIMLTQYCVTIFLFFVVILYL